MRLIECYIDNFGKLSDFSMKFDRALNTVCRENGYGKSTLVAFIRSMLYGLEETKRTKLDENDRRKFEPWQGGAWGGSLTFEADGRCYRVERSFSAKASADECRIFDTDTGKECFQFGDCLGEALFGIDRDGFERTLLLSEKPLSDKCDNKTIAAKLSDLAGVDADIAGLDSALDILEEERKFYTKQSGNGEIHSVKERIAYLEEKQIRLASLSSIHERDKEKLADIEKEISLLQKNLQEKKKAASELERRELLLSSYREALKRKNEEGARLAALLRFFGGVPPNSEEIYRAMSASASADELRRSIAEGTARHEALGTSASLPTEEEICELKKKHEALRITEATAEEKAEAVAAPKKSEIKVRVPLILAAAASALAAVLLGIFVMPALYAAAALSAVFLIFSFKKCEEARDGLEAELEKLKSDISLKRQELTKALAVYGINTGDISTSLDALRLKLREAELREEALEKERARLAEAKKTYESFIINYPVSAEGALDEIKEKLTAYEITSKLYERSTRECEEAEREHGFTPNDTDKSRALPSFSSDDTQIRELERVCAALFAKCRRDEATLDEAEEISAELERLGEKLREYRARVAIIKKTKDYLVLAKDNMNAKYLGKTKEAFESYISLITEIDEEFSIDTSFALSKREGGRTKPREAYSRGLRDLYSFALRLALTDALYENERPFIVIDDAFAYFDSAKLAKAKELLRRLAEKHQIIYMTASDERAI